MQHAALTRQQQHALPLLAYRPHRSVPHEETETKRRAHGPQPKFDNTTHGVTRAVIVMKKDGAAPARVAAPLGLGWDGGKKPRNKTREDTTPTVEAATLAVHAGHPCRSSSGFW